MWTPFAEALGQNRCGMLLGIRGSMEAGADAAGRQGGRHDGGGPAPGPSQTFLTQEPFCSKVTLASLVKLRDQSLRAERGR